jgi:hypothetical protein
MTTVSTAVYENGVVIPAIKPPRPPREVVVVFVEENEKETAASSAPPLTLREALIRSRGILSPDHPDGVTFVNTLRKESEDRLRRLDW